MPLRFLFIHNQISKYQNVEYKEGTFEKRNLGIFAVYFHHKCNMKSRVKIVT